MIVTCSSCHKRYRLEEKHFSGRDQFEFKCPNCGAPISATRAEFDAAPAGEGAGSGRPRKNETTWNENDVPDADQLAIPEGKRASVAILQGHDSGTLFPVQKPLLVIGRSEADITLDDGEVSRHHARLEFRGPTITLRDLRSTNGTYVNEERITVTTLANQAEFRVGTTTLMLILTDDTD